MLAYFSIYLSYYISQNRSLCGIVVGMCFVRMFISKLVYTTNSSSFNVRYITFVSSSSATGSAVQAGPHTQSGMCIDSY